MKRKGISNWKLSFFLATTLGILLAFPFGALTAETVRIGMLVPFTGPLASHGQQVWEGFQIAADMVNDKGGLWGKKIEWVKGDSVTPDSAISEMERLITVEKLDIIVGGYSSSRVFAASEVSEKYKKIYLISTAVAEEIRTRGFKYIFCPSATSADTAAGKLMFTSEKVAPALGKKPGDLRVAIIYEDSLFGTSHAKVEMSDGPKSGLKIVSTESYSNKAVDLSSLVMKLRAVKPDVVLMTGYFNDTCLFWRQCKEMGFNIPVLLESGAVVTEPMWLEAMGKEANGTIGTANRLANPKNLSPKGRALQTEAIERLAKKFSNAQPFPTRLNGIESGRILFTEVLPMAGSVEPEKVRQAALKLNLPWQDSPVGLGVRFAPPGHRITGQNLEAKRFLYQWQNEKMVAVYPDYVAEGKAELPMPTWEQREKKK